MQKLLTTYLLSMAFLVFKGKLQMNKAKNNLKDELVQPRLCPTTQGMTLQVDITRWSITTSNYILCSWRWSSSIQSANTRPGADYGSDHELLFATFRLKLKKVRKTTRPFRYNLNQIPCIIQWKWEIDSWN